MFPETGFWRAFTSIAVICSICLMIALTVVVVNKHSALPALGGTDTLAGSVPCSVPCPPKDGGLLTSGDPKSPGPFHDLTKAEYRRVWRFLQQNQDLNLVDPEKIAVNKSMVYSYDLHLPEKDDVLAYLDKQGPQPQREARVIIFRGDLTPPVVQEYCVGPLSDPTYATLMVNSQRRNPVEFSLRPGSGVEFMYAYAVLLRKVDAEVGDILKESYGGHFHECQDTCLTFSATPVGTHLLKDIKRRVWYLAHYSTEYKSIYPLDFGLLANMDSPDPEQWTVQRVWYSGAMYDSLQHLHNNYTSESAAINKTRIPYVKATPKHKSTLYMRGDPQPETPKRPPILVEPDGKRYSISHRHVKYLHWDFDVRMSDQTGPAVYDVRFKGGRVAYELGLSEIAVFYSGNNPIMQITDFVDSVCMLGTLSKTLIAGVDCPDRATFINFYFMGEGRTDPLSMRSMCVFEQATGMPLKRHLSYPTTQGSFYGGMADSHLVVRSIITLSNYDYVVDFIFYQSGAIETRLASTGYVLNSFYTDAERRYGFRIDENIVANMHHHLFHVKADLDIKGTSNRYETLDISNQPISLTQYSPRRTPYNILKFQRHLRQTERDAVYHFNYDHPKYHIVHNEANKTQYGEPSAYRIHMSGITKQLLPENEGNEATISWARQEMAVTVHKHEELSSSSPYAIFDSHKPVTNFSNFISDESIVDQDLVFWVTLGLHHIPHTEDLPITTTPGGHLSVFFQPYNYFPECPSVSSRDNVRIQFNTPGDTRSGVTVDRNGNEANGECETETLEQLAKAKPEYLLDVGDTREKHDN